MSGRRVRAAIVVCAITAVTIFNLSGPSGVAKWAPASRETDSPKLNSSRPAPDYSKFSHSDPKEHADLMGRQTCGSCHRRGDASAAPRFPLHKDCTGCHMIQFTAANSSASANPICTICHKAEALNSSSAPLKSFPRLISFTAEFDHAQHLRGIGSARAPQGCVACHAAAIRGVAETIPARLTAHQICYECHSPGRSANDLSACGYCHKFGRYAPTSTAARAYRFDFSHADHAARAHLSCERCHDVLGRGLPQRRQVSSTITVQHQSSSGSQNCKSCHNDQRAFGDKGPKFDVCTRCHKGQTFGM